MSILEGEGGVIENRETMHSVKEVAGYTGLSLPSVYRAMSAGRLGYIQLGRRRRVLESQLDRFIESCRRDQQATN